MATIHSFGTSEIRMRYEEPYLTEGLNKKVAVALPRGVYRGFLPRTSATALAVTFAADPNTGDSVALLETTGEHSIQVRVAGDLTALDLSAFAGSTVVVYLEASYTLGTTTTATVEAITQTSYNALTQAEKDRLITLATIAVPASGTIPESAIDPTIRKSAADYVAEEGPGKSLKGAKAAAYISGLTDTLTAAATSFTINAGKALIGGRVRDIPAETVSDTSPIFGGAAIAASTTYYVVRPEGRDQWMLYAEADVGSINPEDLVVLSVATNTSTQFDPTTKIDLKRTRVKPEADVVVTVGPNTTLADFTDLKSALEYGRLICKIGGGVVDTLTIRVVADYTEPATTTPILLQATEPFVTLKIEGSNPGVLVTLNGGLATLIDGASSPFTGTVYIDDLELQIPGTGSTRTSTDTLINVGGALQASRLTVKSSDGVPIPGHYIATGNGTILESCSISDFLGTSLTAGTSTVLSSTTISQGGGTPLPTAATFALGQQAKIYGCTFIGTWWSQVGSTSPISLTQAKIACSDFQDIPLSLTISRISSSNVTLSIPTTILTVPSYALDLATSTASSCVVSYTYNQSTASTLAVVQVGTSTLSSCILTGSTISGTTMVGVNTVSTYNTVVGNRLEATNGTNGVAVGTANNTVSGNYIRGFTTGVSITGNNNRVVGNTFVSVTTPVSDTGTGNNPAIANLLDTN